MQSQSSLANNTTFIFKGGNFTLTTLQLLSLDYQTLNQQLAEKVASAPNFFNHTPVVLDISPVANLPVEIDFSKILHIIRDHGMIPVGVRGGGEAPQSRAKALGLAVMADRASKTEEPQVAQPEPVIPEPKTVALQPDPEPTYTTKLITQPVRSGQQVYARGGDLIITASVSEGAEIIADGHIHVYGTLRGRALAGVTGYEKARIFCSCLQAELVSVAGQYCVSDDLRDSSWGRAASIALQGDHLQITPLS